MLSRLRQYQRDRKIVEMLRADAGRREALARDLLFKHHDPATLAIVHGKMRLLAIDDCADGLNFAFQVATAALRAAEAIKSTPQAEKRAEQADISRLQEFSRQAIHVADAALKKLNVYNRRQAKAILRSYARDDIATHPAVVKAACERLGIPEPATAMRPEVSPAALFLAAPKKRNTLLAAVFSGAAVEGTRQDFVDYLLQNPGDVQAIPATEEFLRRTLARPTDHPRGLLRSTFSDMLAMGRALKEAEATLPPVTPAAGQYEYSRRCQQASSILMAGVRQRIGYMAVGMIPDLVNEWRRDIDTAPHLRGAKIEDYLALLSAGVEGAGFANDRTAALLGDAPAEASAPRYSLVGDACGHGGDCDHGGQAKRGTFSGLGLR